MKSTAVVLDNTGQGFESSLAAWLKPVIVVDTFIGDENSIAVDNASFDSTLTSLVMAACRQSPQQSSGWSILN